MKTSLFKTVPSLAITLVAALATLGNIHATEAAKPAPDKEKKFLMAYYPNWKRSPEYTADKIPWQYLTHLLYAFYIPDARGNFSNSDPLDDDNFKEIIRVGHEKGVKILLSIGGAGSSENFKPMAASASARANFVKNALRLCDELKLDGIDLDWEYPVEGDGENQAKLHKELRAAFDKQPRKILLTAAVPVVDYWAHWSPDESFQALDYLNCMTYDYMGTWEKTILPNSGMDQSKATLEYFEKKRGIPASKLVLGAAFYGKTFDGGTGMGSTYEGMGSGNNGNIDWKELLVQLQASPYKIYWDEKTQSEYALGNEEIIVFNGIPSTRVRGDYVRTSPYAGVMLWDLLGDVQETNKSLLVALYRGLRGTNKGPLVLPPTAP